MKHDFEYCKVQQTMKAFFFNQKVQKCFISKPPNFQSYNSVIVTTENQNLYHVGFSPPI